MKCTTSFFLLFGAKDPSSNSNGRITLSWLCKHRFIVEINYCTTNGKCRFLDLLNLFPSKNVEHKTSICEKLLNSMPLITSFCSLYRGRKKEKGERTNSQIWICRLILSLPLCFQGSESCLVPSSIFCDTQREWFDDPGEKWCLLFY